MGLDMYIYKFNKIDKKEINKYRGCHNDDIPYKTLTNEAMMKEPYLYKDLKMFLYQIQIMFSIFEVGKCCEDHDCDLSKMCGAAIGKTIKYSFSDGKYFELSQEELESYCHNSLRDAFLFSREEVCYWRKEYDLQDIIHEAHEKKKQAYFDKKGITPDVTDVVIQNCGYYALTRSERNKIVKYLRKVDESGYKEYIDILTDYDNYPKLFYYEWY